jgi:elongator complex protein 3
MRAIQNNYSARKQILARLNQYKMQGHPTDKCHIIIMGGTFLYAKREERFPFIKEVFETLNNKKAKTLKQAIDKNEYAAHKAIGVTFETRPDYGFEYHANEMLLMGGTQVELGVQVLSDKIYKKIKRGHNVNDVIKSSQILKDCGFKILYHMMPGLFSTPKQDVSFFKRLFSDQRFRPDMLKIYPALVIAGTQLYEMWKNKEFEPYDTYQAAEVIAKATEFIPPYVRISRIQRDIPSPLVSAGVKNSNLRQIVEEKLREEGKTCRCIRCREIGRKGVKDPILTLKRIDYKSSFGKEVFLSFEDERYDAIAAFLRLRFPFRSHRKEINLNAPNPKLFDYQKKPVIFREKLEVEYEPPEIISSIVREIHVYGQEVSIGKIEPEKIQHKGLGKRLLIQAEEITKKEFGLNKIAVISGPGARGYYKKLGYFLDGVYMSKNL